MYPSLVEACVAGSCVRYRVSPFFLATWEVGLFSYCSVDVISVLFEPSWSSLNLALKRFYDLKAPFRVVNVDNLCP